MEKQKAALEALGASIIAASADDEANAAKFAADVTFPIGFGVTRAETERMGAWWGEQRANMQPAEFLIGQNGVVMHSLYASGPVGRMSAEELVRQLTRLADLEKAAKG